MVYDAIWHEKALKDLQKIDKEKARQIVNKVKTYLVNSPETIGKGLTGKFKGMFRYRFGDYRIIYTINKSLKKINILLIDHRSEVYKSK